MEVPVTPAVLEWAIEESGYTLPQVADEAGLDPRELTAWLRQQGRPGLTAVRALARVLRRPVATFLLPRPPVHAEPAVSFRHLPGGTLRSLTPTERRYVRKAARTQRMVASLVAEMGETGAAVPVESLSQDPADVATRIRLRLDVSLKTQMEWRSASAAFDGWRASIEDLGILVFLFQLGPDNCRGFSLWHDSAPVIAVNTAWNDEARTFTLFHKLGHLLTRTDSACATAPPANVAGAWDPAERWCEQFAAAVLVPEAAVADLLTSRLTAKPVDIATIRWFANKLHVSLRAATIRLIGLHLATWNTYRALPQAVDAKRRGGAGGSGRDRQEIHEDQLGNRTTELFRRAVRTDVLTRSEALTYLDVPETALDSSSHR